MSLQTKITLILLAVIGCVTVVSEVFARGTLTERFEFIEQRAALDDMASVKRALRNEVSAVDSIGQRWATSNDTYAYMDETSEAYEASRLIPSILAIEGIDLLYLVDLDGTVRWSRIVDSDSGEEIGLKDFPREEFHGSHPLLTKLDRPLQNVPTEKVARIGHHAGLMLTEHLPLIVCAWPIINSKGEKTSRGTLIVGRFLGEGLNTVLRKRTSVTFEAWQLNEPKKPLPVGRDLLDRVTVTDDPVLVADSPEWMFAYQSLLDIRHRPEVLLRATIPRHVTQAGSVALRSGSIWNLAAALLLILTLVGLLRGTVIKPLSQITSHVLRIGHDEDFGARLDLDRPDELGTLSGEIDSMMGKLQAARSALIQTARTAGKTEIANGILHNVGNVLNSVNVAATLIAERAEKINVADLDSISILLRDYEGGLLGFCQNDARAEHLQPLLGAIVDQVDAEKDGIATEVGILTQGIDNIRELIQAQQTYSVKVELVEETNVSECMDEALKLSENAGTKRSDIRIVREYDDMPPILLDRHKLLEILVHLILNARQALGTGEEREPVLTLSCLCHGEETVAMRVSDTGKGVPEEFRDQIFGLGFSTRDGGSGYGLHSAANSAIEMGGKLRLREKAPDSGASFELQLPLRTESNEEIPV